MNMHDKNFSLDNKQYDELSKTSSFIKKGLILWVIFIIIFIAVQLLITKYGDIELKRSNSALFEQLNGVTLIFGVIMLPIIMMILLSLLKKMQKKINNIGGQSISNDENRNR